MRPPGDEGLPPPPAAGWPSIPANGAPPTGFGASPGAWQGAPGYGPGPTPYAYGYGAPPFAKPSNNLVGAILATLFCCLPTGIAAIVFAAQVDSKWAAGDWNGAKESSRKAQMWSNISLGLGLLAIIAWAALAATSNTGGSGY